MKKESFVKVPTAFLENLYASNLNKNELTICLAIIRYTFGFRQEVWQTTGSYIARITNIDEAAVSRSLKSLELKNVVERGRSKKFRISLKFKKQRKEETKLEQKIQAIETEYNGYRFRSRLEARWAVFFDAIGAKYIYEPQGYVFEDGTCYLPDFYLENVSGRGARNIFVEIKGVLDDVDLRKVELFSMSKQIIIFGQIPDVNSSGYLDFRKDGNDNIYNLAYSEGDYYLAEPKASIHGGLVLDYPDNPYSYVDDALTKAAYSIARQARFEHGETQTAEQVYKEAHKKAQEVQRNANRRS